MSIRDFLTGLFRDPANLRSFVDDPDQALTPNKALGDLFTPHIEEGGPAPVDDYPNPPEDDEPDHDHAIDDGGVDLDISAVVWGEAVE